MDITLENGLNYSTLFLRSPVGSPFFYLHTPYGYALELA